jgi:hypothetical protein
VSLLIIVGYFAIWWGGAYLALRLVQPLAQRTIIRSALSAVLVATVFAGDTLYSLYAVSPVAVPTFVSMYRAGDFPEPRFPGPGKEACVEFTILSHYPAQACTFRVDTGVHTRFSYSTTLLRRPIDIFPYWTMMSAAWIDSDNSDVACLTIANDTSRCEII